MKSSGKTTVAQNADGMNNIHHQRGIFPSANFAS